MIMIINSWADLRLIKSMFAIRVNQRLGRGNLAHSSPGRRQTLARALARTFCPMLSESSIVGPVDTSGSWIRRRRPRICDAGSTVIQGMHPLPRYAGAIRTPEVLIGGDHATIEDDSAAPPIRPSGKIGSPLTWHVTTHPRDRQICPGGLHAIRSEHLYFAVLKCPARIETPARFRLRTQSSTRVRENPNGQRTT